MEIWIILWCLIGFLFPLYIFYKENKYLTIGDIFFCSFFSIGGLMLILLWLTTIENSFLDKRIFEKKD